jgi:hypothetical protein
MCCEHFAHLCSEGELVVHVASDGSNCVLFEHRLVLLKDGVWVCKDRTHPSWRDNIVVEYNIVEEVCAARKRD